MARARSHPAFWDRRRTRVVVEALKDAQRALETSPEVLVDYLAKLVPELELPDRTGLRRLLTGATDRPQKLERLANLMQALETLYRLEKGREFDVSQREALLSLAEDHRNTLSAWPPTKAGGASNPTPDPVAFVQALAGVLKVDLVDVKRRFFAEGDDPAQPLRFLIYRFDSTPGQILKSYLELWAPTKGPAACIFQHTAKVPDQVADRRTTGLVLPSGTTLSFVGQATEGPGLKVMTLRMPARPKERYNGLLLSFDERDSPVCSRFVMVRTTHDSPDTAGLGLFPQTSLASEIADFEDELANAIPTHPDSAVFNRGRRLTPEQVAALVERRLREAGDDLTDEAGRPFNPAAPESFPFNAALRILSD